MQPPMLPIVQGYMLHHDATSFCLELFGHPTQDRFDERAIVPGTLMAVAKGAIRAAWFAKTEITERKRLTLVRSDHLTKGMIRFIGTIPPPIRDLTTLIDQERNLNPDDPASV
jgi:hypothetical protein